MLWCLLRLGVCLLCHGSGEVFAPIVSLFLNSLTVGTGEEVVASDILLGAQPRIRCWARARSSSSELVDTATARRQQRVEDATRVGLQFPFLPERRGPGAPTVAMKWRDALRWFLHACCTGRLYDACSHQYPLARSRDPEHPIVHTWRPHQSTSCRAERW